MFDLLIVDDDAIAVRGIVAGVDWERIHISKVHTAGSVGQARTIMENRKIDILLCDIEMPRENGFDLLEWVSRSHPETGTVMLTCHSDFEYARRAMQLGSIDYALKSMTYDELTRTIGKAARKIAEERKTLRYSRFGKLWFQNQDSILERFWLDIIEGRIGPDQEEIRRESEKAGLRISELPGIIPVLLVFNSVGTEPSENGVHRNMGAIRERVRDLSARSGVSGRLIPLKPNELLFLVFSPQIGNEALERIYSGCRTPALPGGKETASSLSLYAGRRTSVYGLGGMFRKLREMQSNNVVLKSGVFSCGGRSMPPKAIDLSDMRLWSDLLKEEDYKRLLQAIDEFFRNSVKEGEIGAAFLRQFQQDFLQILYALLKQKGIPAHRIFDGERSVKFFDGAVRSVFEMRRWIRFVIGRIVEENTAAAGNSAPVVEKAKAYISLHLCDHLSRGEIAAHVYVNPDYLTRLFKKETGTTLSGYIQNKRIQYAKSILKKSDINIVRVAMDLGYSNLSNFARAFKYITGLSPSEFRKAGSWKREAAESDASLPPSGNDSPAC